MTCWQEGYDWRIVFSGEYKGHKFEKERYFKSKAEAKTFRVWCRRKRFEVSAIKLRNKAWHDCIEMADTLTRLGYYGELSVVDKSPPVDNPPRPFVSKVWTDAPLDWREENATRAWRIYQEMATQRQRLEDQDDRARAAWAALTDAQRDEIVDAWGFAPGF